MNKIYQVYQVSDSTGETLDRIFLAIKAQFSNFECKTIHFSFTRTENQINKIISKCKSEQNVIVLYTIVDDNLAKYLARLLSTIVYKAITFFSDLHLDIIFFIWFSVRVKEKWIVLHSKLENCALMARKILSNVSPVESETW